VIRIDAGRLRPGKNLLAVQGLNRSLDSSDLVVGPVLRGAFVQEPPEPEEVRERFDRAGSGESLALRRSYVEGRALQLRGDFGQAAARFEKLVAEDSAAPEPALRLAQCLEALDRSPDAAGVLRGALERTPAAFAKALWDAWLRVSLVNLGRRPGELVEELPSTRANGEEIDGASPAEPSYGGAVAWLLETLAKGEPLRINCGGVEYRSLDGAVWREDCFAAGGRRSGTDSQPLFHPFPDIIDETDDDPLYQTGRWFPPFREKTGYRIPVPPGSYSVTLHFAESVFKTGGLRRFHVLVEGEPFLEDYRPPLRKADRRVIETRVDDGVLEVDFVHGAANHPQISAIEVVETGRER
jgi:hypothetical protein